MERGDDGGVVTGNHAGWTPAQGFVRYHHGRGGLAGARGVQQTLSIWRRLPRSVPLEVCGTGPACNPPSYNPPSCHPPAPARPAPAAIPAPRSDRTYRVSGARRGCGGRAGEVAAAAFNKGRAVTWGGRAAAVGTCPPTRRGGERGREGERGKEQREGDGAERRRGG